MTESARRILIVDDNKDILENLSDILNDLGYETETATCAEDAIVKLEKNCPSPAECQYGLCVLDFKMPGIDGVELYERILEFNPDLKAIMVTAFAGEDGVKRAVEAGTWQILRKPVDIRHLLKIIAEAIE